MGKSSWFRVSRHLAPVLALVLLGPLPSMVVLGSDATNPTDQQIKGRIEQQLRSDIRLRDVSLDLQVVGGQVTLQGELPSFLERNRLERICRRIQGVSGVINRVTVVPVPRNDRELRRAVEQRLAADPALRISTIEVEANRGIVKLTGNVDSLYGRRRAQTLAEQIRGVSRVLNGLTLGQPDAPHERVPDEQISRSIQEILNRDARSIERAISWSVREGEVTLEGVVSSNARRRFYRYLVEKMPGVRSVINRLEVNPIGSSVDTTAPSMNEVALDLQLVLDVAAMPPETLHAQLAEEKIAVVGTVASLARKQQVLRLAQDFASSFPVVSGLKVANDERSSESLRMELSQRLESDVLLADAGIEVSVDQQVATLSGSVDRFADRIRAERLASAVDGIRSIDNRLLVDWMATTSDQALKERIEQRLEGNRFTASVMEAIAVNVQQGRVRMTGRLPSAELRRQVAFVVDGTDGIRSVENQIVVDEVR